jgi:phage tail sheath gpL-like
MTGILKPDFTFSIIPASQLASVQAQKVLIIGQMLAAGTAVAGDLITDLTDNTSQINALFGRRSHIAGMIRAFKRENEITRLDVIPLDDESGSPGTAIFVVAGTATEDGTIVVSCGSKKDFAVTIDITSGDLHTDVATAIETAFALLLDAPFQGVDVAGTITFTSENDGTLSDEWDIRVDGEVSGITFTITGWTGGATDPTLTTILDVIGDIRYQTIVWPSVYPLDTVETLLNARFNASNQILDGVVLQAFKGTTAELIAYANQNSQSVVIISNQTISVTNKRVGTMVPEMPDIMVAEIAAVRALRLTEDAPLTSYLSSVASSDQFGGIALASLPYFNTLMPNLPVPNEEDSWTSPEMTELEDAGVAVVGGNRVFNGVILGGFVTTYLTNGAGNPDLSYQFLNTVDTASVIREFFFENSRSRYAQTRLTNGSLVAGRDMANNGSIRAFFNELYDELSEEVLVQKGTAAKKDFNDNLSIVLDLSQGKVTYAMAPLLVTGLRVMIGTMQINFGS